jgi:hypothetical protein
MDDTLVPLHREDERKADCRLLCGDLVGAGGIQLLKDLQREHELWIYTTSYRVPWKVRWSFWLRGIRIRRGIQEGIHRRMIREYSFQPIPSKYPKHFGIDLHIDDSLGVLAEGKRLGFEVLWVDARDPQWIETVRCGIASLVASRA